jgi:hypothetical protein
MAIENLGHNALPGKCRIRFCFFLYQETQAAGPVKALPLALPIAPEAKL